MEHLDGAEKRNGAHAEKHREMVEEGWFRGHKLKWRNVLRLTVQLPASLRKFRIFRVIAFASSHLHVALMSCIGILARTLPHSTSSHAHKTHIESQNLHSSRYSSAQISQKQLDSAQHIRLRARNADGSGTTTVRLGMCFEQHEANEWTSTFVLTTGGDTELYDSYGGGEARTRGEQDHSAKNEMLKLCTEHHTSLFIQSCFRDE